MSKVLVVHGTKSGCTAEIAARIGERIAAAGLHVDVVAAHEAPGAGGYDAVVVGSGIRAGQWHEAARAWVATNAEPLSRMPVATFTCGLTITQGAEKAAEVANYARPVFVAAGIEPISTGLFAGAYEPKRFSLLERAIMKAMKTPVGDFRDWDAIDVWADGVAHMLGQAA